MLSSLFQGSSIQEVLLQLLYRIPGILVALSFHEWAHAYAAYRLGDPTARNLGRMTVNPLAHLDYAGLALLILVRFGWAKPVPINPRNFKKPRRDEIIVSVAGVLVNLVLAFVSLGVWGILLNLGVYNEIVNQILLNFCFINLGLFVFNIIPIPPLDGSHVLECLLIRHIGSRFFEVMDRWGYLILIVLLFSGALTSVLSTVVNAILNGMMWVYGLIGLF